MESEMSRISRSALLRAIKAVQEMTVEQKLGLTDEIFSAQPNMLAAVLVLRNLGVPAPKQEFALEMLFLCFQAMKESGLTWPLITEDEQEDQVRRHTTLLRFLLLWMGNLRRIVPRGSILMPIRNRICWPG
jgi:hypothetical protein